MKECNELLQFRWQNVGGNILLPLSFNVVRLKLTFISSGFVFYYMFLLTVQNRGSLDVSLRDYLQRQALTSRVPLFNGTDCSPVREINVKAREKIVSMCAPDHMNGTRGIYYSGLKRPSESSAGNRAIF